MWWKEKIQGNFSYFNIKCVHPQTCLTAKGPNGKHDAISQLLWVTLHYETKIMPRKVVKQRLT